MSCTFNPALLSKWNLFASPLLTSDVKTRVVGVSWLATESVAVLSLRGGSVLQFEATSLKETSTIGFWPEELVCGTAVKNGQTMLPVAEFAKGLSKAAKLEIPGVLPPMAGPSQVEQLGACSSTYFVRMSSEKIAPE